MEHDAQSQLAVQAPVLSGGSSLRKVYIKTYGCQMNIYDSERIAEMLSAIGFEESGQPDGSDVVILNTCHIREKAAEKVYSELGRIKQEKEKMAKNGQKMIIVVAGCVAQAEGDEVTKRAPFVDIVIGTESYHHLPDLISQAIRGTKSYSILDFTADEKFDVLPKARSASGPSSFVTVQEGCDKFCTFCVVPYTRGPEFSRPVDDIFAEVKQLADGGSAEVTLLGQNVNAYHGVGGDGKEKGLDYLIARLSEIETLERIRYTTSHPINVSDGLIEEHGKNPKLMPFLHLPVQSGSNKVLRLMNRKHTRQEYLKIIEKLRKGRPDILLSSDFIVASPGESDEDFRETLSLVEEVGFSQSYSFKYSPRPGTPSAAKEQIPQDVASERLKILQNLLDEQQKGYNKQFLNKTLPVLLDSKGKRKEYLQISGRSPYMHAVSVEDSDASRVHYGKVVDIKITEIKKNTLAGKIAA